MVRRFKRKVHKLRGHRTRGWGNSKRRRGRGSRRTNTGTFSRNFTYFAKYEPERIGREKGFNTKFNAQREKRIAITLEELNKLALQTSAKEFNLKEMGYYKILGSGNIEVPIEVYVEKITESAKNKIEKAGGKVHILE
jgi:large subunit ribosomal protein L15